MLISLATLVLSFSLSSTLAQVLISTSIPACGQQCAILLQAQAGCVPPAAPVTNPNIYQSCFCQSTFLTPLFVGGSTTICPACSPEEMGTIENWYQTLCAPPDQGSPNQAPPDQAPPDAQPAAPSSTSTAAKAAAPTVASNAAKGGATISEKPPPDNRGWSVSYRLR